MAREPGGGNNQSSLRGLLFLGMSLLTGVVLVVVLYQMISSYQARIEDAKRPEDTVMVIVANRDLYPGVTITEDDLFAIGIAPRYLPEGVYLSPDHVIGRIPRERILANEFVRSNRLADPESGIGLNAVIPRGMRAISIRVAEAQALAGFLNPGNYVDLLVTFTPDGSSGVTTTTKTLLQAVFVLGVNSRMQKETAAEAAKRGAAEPSVTLLVTAEQAEQVAHAENLGALTLTLLNDQDVGETQLAMGGVDVAKLREVLTGQNKVEQERSIGTVRKPRPVAGPAPAPEGTLKICRGGNCTEQAVDQQGVIKN